MIAYYLISSIQVGSCVNITLELNSVAEQI